MKSVEWFSLECRKIIGFTCIDFSLACHHNMLHDWLKKKLKSHVFDQSEVRPRPIVTRSRTFSQARLITLVLVRNTGAPSTRIRISLYPQLFLSGFKNFPVHTKRIQIKFASPHASDGIRFTVVPSSPR